MHTANQPTTTPVADDSDPILITPKWRAFAYLFPVPAAQEDSLILSDSAEEIEKLPAGSTRTILESLLAARAADVSEGRELVEEESLDNDDYRAFLGNWNTWRDEAVARFQSLHNRRRAL